MVRDGPAPTLLQVDPAARELIGLLQGPTPGSPEALAAAAEKLDIDWPSWYVDVLSAIDGGEGWVGESYLRLMGVAEMIFANEQLETARFARLNSLWLGRRRGGVCIR
jgi:hypothetical protein